MVSDTAPVHTPTVTPAPHLLHQFKMVLATTTRMLLMLMRSTNSCMLPPSLPLPEQEKRLLPSRRSSCASFGTYASSSQSLRAWRTYFGHGWLGSFAVLALEHTPQSLKQALASPKKHFWLQAYNTEIGNLERNDTWVAASLPVGRRALSTNHNFTRKRNANGEIVRYKVRLVVKGFAQIFGLEFNDTYAPVGRGTTFCFLIATAVQAGGFLLHWDVQTAFIEAELDEDVYIMIPEGLEDKFPAGSVLRLKRSLYGLRQASRNWYETLKAASEAEGFKAMASDKCLYCAEIDGSAIWTFTVVDDLFVRISELAVAKRVLLALQKKFANISLGLLRSAFGIRIDYDRTKDVARLDQEEFIKDVVERFGMTGTKGRSKPIVKGAPNEALKHRRAIKEESEAVATKGDGNLLSVYPAAVGSVLYIAINSRPDNAYAYHVQLRFNSEPNSTAWAMVKDLVGYLKQIAGKRLEYRRDGPSEVVSYADADFAESRDWKSVSAGVFTYAAGAFF